MDTEIYVPNLPEINPMLLGLIILAVFILFIILMCVFIPRLDQIRKLEKDNSELKAAKHYAEEQWSIERVRANKAEKALKQQIRDAENRKKQADDKAKQISKSYDMLIDRLLYDVVTYRTERIIKEEDIFFGDLTKIDERVLDDILSEFVKQARKDGLFSFYRVEKSADRSLHYEFKIDILKEK